MPERIHLAQKKTPMGTAWYTLVVDGSLDYFVEIYNDSPLSFPTERTHKIGRDDLKNHSLNDVPLIKLVEQKFQDMAVQSAPALGHSAFQD